MKWIRRCASCAIAAALVAALAGCGPAQYKNDQAPDQNVNQMLEGMKQPTAGPAGATPAGGGQPAPPPGDSAAPPTIPSGGR